MPVVKIEGIDASNDNSPHTPNVDVQIDLALLLSEFYGKMIRQGNSFCVDGVQAWLRPADLNNLEFQDIGVSAAVKLGFIPTTGHSRKAWNNVFQQWKAQKNLAGAVGPQVRYDDMEFCWEHTFNTARTSTLYSTGIGDNSQERLCLVGSSDGGVDFSLADYYNSSYETPPASRNHFDNSVIKEPKHGSTPFPEPQSIYCAATNSSGIGVIGETDIPDVLAAGTGVTTPNLTPEGLFSSTALSEMNMLPTPIHVLCGLMRARAWISPDDTVDQLEEDMALDIAISVRSWKSLVYRAKTKSWMRGRKGSRKKSGRSYGRQYNRRSRR